ncbi:MAG: hypothetical protein KTR31_14295 [Myxococcales bacterium]|nr:hypothetical protein [Myxococcales bacterium]
MWLFVWVGACASAPDGLRPTPDGDGPRVVVDWDAEPLPEIPFPNDLATRTDPTSVTGLRLNISEEADTHGESEARAKLNEMVGFGIYAPITVAFDAPLDLDEILARHPDDFHTDRPFDDDAVLLFAVDPDGPTYLQPVPLDIGHGRFPVDVPRTDRYFPNDPRADSPTVMFDTVDEDLNGNGVMDPGEDTDNDGWLDVANVWPIGGDPREDLLSWYDRLTDTLIVRPVTPLREQTTYAVVLTENLRGMDGAPVVSPWGSVNHTRQTDALLPVLDGLQPLGMGVNDVAFAWTFTTGRVTGDLVDIHRGLNAGVGPWPQLRDDFPAGLTEMLPVVSDDDPHNLPVLTVVEPLGDLGLFPEESVDPIVDAYGAYGDRVVGATFMTPYLLADRDDGGHWDADEWWQLDPVAGTIHAEPQRVPFTCVVPRAQGDLQPPFDVAVFGHGYGSSRFDGLGFAHAFNRMGFTACFMDFPGHGPTLDPDDAALIEVLLDGLGLRPFYEHLLDSRYRDLDNDGVRDSGGDQWSADAFHTRDMVRQAAVDWMQLVRSLRQCGEGTMDVMVRGANGLQATGTRTTCDFDDDGQIDFGGPDVRYALVGGSLGGIDASVAAAVMPELSSAAMIVPGGGTVDIAARTEIGGAVEAMFGRLVAPLFLGYPDGKGGLDVVQMVNSVVDMRTLPVGVLDAVPAGGTVRIENLDNGEVREATIPADGRFRVGIPADALDPFDKRAASGMPLTGPEPDQIYTAADTTELGDQLVVTILDATGAELAVFDTWPEDVLHEGVTMPAGSTLVAASEGTGHIRGTPDLRRLALVLAAALEPGDAISYARHWFEEPFEELGAQPLPVMVVPTAGDTIVNVNTGIALARAAGIVDYTTIDDRYGITADRFLIDRQVVRGLYQYGPYTDGKGNPVLFDADDLDNGTDGLGAPSDEPLRLSVPMGDGQVSGLRIPYVDPEGSHGFLLPDDALPFDINAFAIAQIAHFLATDGTELSDDPCLERGDCAFLRQPEVR